MWYNFNLFYLFIFKCYTNNDMYDVIVHIFVYEIKYYIILKYVANEVLINVQRQYAV